MKHILIILFSVITLSAFGQTGSISHSVYRSRVNDSTTVVPSDASGYGSIYWNNQATNPGWRVWVDGVGYVIWDPTASGSGGWATTGTTNLTGDATIDNGVHNLLIGDIAGPWSSWDIDGSGPTTIPNSRSDGIGDPLGTTHSYLRHAVNGDDSEALLSVKNATGSEESYIVVGASSAPSINLGTTGEVNINTDGAQRLSVHPNGSWRLGVAEDAGTAGYVLQSNGASAEPTWVAPSGGGGGGGGVNVFAPNIQTGDYTAVPGDTITVIYMRNVSTPQTLTIPLNDFPVGSFITVVQDTTAVTTIDGEPGVDIVGSLTLTLKELAVFHQRSSNVWVRIGSDGDAAFESGTYTPTLTNSANITASTPYLCTYMRVDNTVTFSGRVDIDPTLATTTTTLGISLPVSSAFTTANQAGGVAFAPGFVSDGAAIFSDETNDRLTLQYISTDVTNHAYYFNVTYQRIP